MNIPEYNRTLPADFNWFAVLKDLASGASLSWDDHYRLMMLANTWPTCACGQLCQSLPRNCRGAPEDPVLVSFGTSFSSQISNKNWNRALEIMHKIEERTSELLGFNNALAENESGS